MVHIDKKPKKRRSGIALGMITLRTGTGSYHKDKRNRRGKLDKEWKKEIK
jgi:hypothetical protein